MTTATAKKPKKLHREHKITRYGGKAFVDLTAKCVFAKGEPDLEIEFCSNEGRSWHNLNEEIIFTQYTISFGLYIDSIEGSAFVCDVVIKIIDSKKHREYFIYSGREVMERGAEGLAKAASYHLPTNAYDTGVLVQIAGAIRRGAIPDILTAEGHEKAIEAEEEARERGR
jgi:hypothetical protein